MTAPGLEVADRQRRSGAAAVLLVGFAVLASVFFVRQTPLFVIGYIGDDFAVDEGARGTLTAAIGVGWALGLLSARWTSHVWSDRRRALFGLTIAAVGCIVVVAAPAWWVVVLGQGAACCGAGSATPAVMSSAYGAVAPSRRGLAAGTVLSGSRIGGNLVAPIVVLPLAAWVTWRIPVVMGATAIVALGIVAHRTLSARPPVGQGVGRRRPLEYHSNGRRNLVISAFNCAALLVWVTAIAQFGEPVVEDWLGPGPALAGGVLGSFGVGAAIGAFVVPTWSDRIGRRAGQFTTMALGAVSGTAILVLNRLDAGSVLVGLLVLGVGGLAMGGLPMALSLIPADTVAVGDPGRAMVMPALVAELAGGGIAPAVLAILAAHFGPTVPIAGAAGLLTIGATASLVLAAMPSPSSAVGPGR